MICNRLEDFEDFENVDGFYQVIDFKLNGSTLHFESEADGDGCISNVFFWDDYYTPAGCNVCRDEGCWDILEVLEEEDYMGLRFNQELNKDFKITETVDGEERTVTARIVENKVFFNDEKYFDCPEQFDDYDVEEEEFFIDKKLEKGYMVIVPMSDDSSRYEILNHGASDNPQKAIVKTVLVEKSDNGDVTCGLIVLGSSN